MRYICRVFWIHFDIVFISFLFKSFFSIKKNKRTQFTFDVMERRCLSNSLQSLTWNCICICMWSSISYTTVHKNQIISAYRNGFFFFCLIPGGVGLLWSIFWFALIYESPAVHPRISAEERREIEEAIGSTTSKRKPTYVPWRDILTAPCVWAIIITHATSVFGYFTITNQLPTYMKTILHFNIKEVSVCFVICVHTPDEYPKQNAFNPSSF